MGKLFKRARAKINLGLNVIAKRADGFHDIETIFYPIELSDTLHFNPSNIFIFSSDKPELTADAEDNLIVKAVRKLEAYCGNDLRVHIHLEKKIPTGAGLGGGSSDAASTLLTLNELLQLNIPLNELSEMALQLGSDVPFFLKPIPALGEGRGEILTPFPLSLNGYYLLLVNPGIHINTGWAYSLITPEKKSKPLSALEYNSALLNFITIRNILSNDFEWPVLKRHPEIGEIKEQMNTHHAVYSQMSGSGSSVYGIFDSMDLLKKCINTINKNYFIYYEKLT